MAKPIQAVFITLLMMILPLPLLAQDADTDGDGLSDGWEAGMVVAAGPNGVLDTAPAAGDSLKDGAIWLGTDMVPSTAATGDDLQIIPLALPCPRLFLTDPAVADSDGDGVNDGFEVLHGSDPTDAAITPSLIKTVDKVLGSGLYALFWAGSGYLGFFRDLIITPECESSQWECKINLKFQRLDRLGRPVTPIRTLVRHSLQYPGLQWIDDEMWIATGDARGGLFIRLNANGDRVVPDRRSYDPSLPGVWNGSQLVSNQWSSLTGGFIFYRYGADGVFLDSTEIPDLSMRVGGSRGVWNGVEYGFPVAAEDLTFARLSEDLGLISRTNISDMTPAYAWLVWTGSEYALSFSEGVNEANGNRLPKLGAGLPGRERITPAGRRGTTGCAASGHTNTGIHHPWRI